MAVAICPPSETSRNMRSIQPTRRRSDLGRFVALVMLSGAALSMWSDAVAQAGITGSTGAVNVRAAPGGTLSDGSLESDTQIQVWFESRISSPGAQNMDHVGAGLVDSTIFGNLPTAGTVTPGEALSYFVHIDQTTDAANIQYTGSVTFSAPILGLWFSTGGLGGSDAQWKPAGLGFGTQTNRNWDLFPFGAARNFTISANQRTLTINQENLPNEIDQIRVLVNPEPSSAILAGLGVLGLAALVRRRRKRALRAAQ